MLRRIAKLAGVFVGLLAAVGGAAMLVVLVAMRTKSPRLLRAVRSFNRELTNKLQRRSAGSPGTSAGLIRHRGRASGSVYETPVVPFVHGGDVVVSLPYGSGTDWLRNAIAAGGAELRTGGKWYVLGAPEVVPVAAMGHAFPPRERRAHRIFGVEHCARFQRVAPSPE